MLMNRTADLSYFRFARDITDSMVARFFDATSGGFFDSEPPPKRKKLGVLSTPRKPLQDSPTPAGNPMAAIALIRLHHYTGDASYRDKAEQTLETFAGVAEQFGIFAATFGIAVAHYLENPLQVVVIDGEGRSEERLRICMRPPLRLSHSAKACCDWPRTRRSLKTCPRLSRKRFPTFHH